MGDRIDDLAERVQAVETRMDQVPASIEQRFDSVDAAILEQREYTEFAFDKLERSMNARFDVVDARFDAVDARFDAVDARFAGIDAKFAGVDAQFAEIKAEVRTVSSGVGRLERKLDQVIDRLPPSPRSDTSAG
jgi:chromosome segregation ATPase